MKKEIRSPTLRYSGKHLRKKHKIKIHPLFFNRELLIDDGDVCNDSAFSAFCNVPSAILIGPKVLCIMHRMDGALLASVVKHVAVVNQKLHFLI